MKQHGGSVREQLRLIAKYPFTQVKEKLLLEGKLSAEVVDEAISEFRKYLSLIVLGHSRLAMTSSEVDEVWHIFILFTKDYADFCDRIFGKFLHHQPSIPSNPIEQSARDAFFSAYRQHFGEPPATWRESMAGAPTDGCCGEECAPDRDCNSQFFPEPKPESVLPLH